MSRVYALMKKEVVVLFASPIAYGVLFMVSLVTAIVFFEHLRLYNQILFLYASSTMGGFETDTIPTHVNLRDTVFNPVMEQLGVLLTIPIPLVTMRVFAEERDRGTEELLLTSGLSHSQVIAAKFAVTFAFVVVMMAASFIYPVTAIGQGSAFTSSQIIAAAATVALTFVLYDFGWTHAFVSEGVAQFLDTISLHQRFGHFSEGIVYLADVVYFVGLIAVAAAVVRLSFELRRVGA